MSFVTDYPSTNFYDGELGFLIKEYQEMKATYEAVKNDLVVVKDSIAILENEMVSFKKDISSQLEKFTKETNEKIQNKFDLFSDYMDSEFAKIEKKFDLLNDDFIKFTDKIDGNICDFRKEINDFKTFMENNYQSFVLELESRFNSFTISITKQLNAKEEVIRQWTSELVKKSYDDLLEVIEEWEKVFPPVTNPINGETEPLEEVLHDLYIINVNGITAQQFDDSKLTASEFDGKGITALVFDTKGYEYLYRFQPCMMFSPFSGEWIYISDVVWELAKYHMGATTALEFDLLEITALKFDEKNITAKDFDWKGKGVLTSE